MTINIELSDILSKGFELPSGYSWDVNVQDGKKEGLVKVLNEEGVLYAELVYKNDQLNGECTFYEDGEIKEKIMYKDDIADGWSSIFEDGKETQEYCYENGKKTKSRKRVNTTIWQESDIGNESDYKLLALDENNQPRGQIFCISNDKLVKIEVGIDGEIKTWKTMTSDIMKEYDEEGQLVYEGMYYLSIKLYCPRMGKGKEYHNGKVIFDGLWLFENPLGEGEEFDENGNTLHKGYWCNGLFIVGEDQVYNYETKQIEHMKFTIRSYEDYCSIDNNIPKLVIPDNCCNEKEMKEFVITNFPNLCYIEIGNNCLKKVSDFNIYDLDNLVSLKIGNDCCKSFSGAFSISNVNDLEEIIIGSNSFASYDGFGLEELPHLKRLQIGSLNLGNNFYTCHCILSSFPRLEQVIIGKSSFGGSMVFIIAYCPHLETVQLGSKALSGNRLAVCLKELPELKTLTSNGSSFSSCLKITVEDVPNLENLSLPGAFTGGMCVPHKLSNASKFEELQYGCCSIM